MSARPTAGEGESGGSTPSPATNCNRRTIMDVPSEMQDVAAYFEDWDSAHRSGRLDDCGADFDDEFASLANEAKAASRKLVLICQALFARVKELEEAPYVDPNHEHRLSKAQMGL